MLVSVIVPVYNVEKYLNKCVDSILNNTYKNIEVILVNDGSSDNCGQICDEYQKKDERIVVIHKENGGLSSARNAGLEIAKGGYICFVDSDDYIDSEMIDCLLKRAIESNADIVQCGFDRVDEQGNAKSETQVADWTIEGDDVIESYYTQSKVMPVVAWNKLFKRQLIESTGFMVGRNNEDNIFMADVLSKVKIWSSAPYIFYHYLIRENSIMRAPFSEKKFDSIFALKYVYDKTKEEFPQYLDYIKFSRALNAFYLYYDIWSSKKSNKREFYRVVVEEFNENYTANLKRLKVEMKDSLRLRLFDFNKNLAVMFYNIYLILHK